MNCTPYSMQLLYAYNSSFYVSSNHVCNYINYHVTMASMFGVFAAGWLVITPILIGNCAPRSFVPPIVFTVCLIFGLEGLVLFAVYFFCCLGPERVVAPDPFLPDWDRGQRSRPVLPDNRNQSQQSSSSRSSSSWSIAPSDVQVAEVVPPEESIPTGQPLTGKAPPRLDVSVFFSKHYKSSLQNKQWP